MPDKSLINEITSKNMQTWLDKREFGPYWFTNFFDFEEIDSMDIDALIGTIGRAIAADVYAEDTSTGVKSRKAIGKWHGEIPIIKIARDMSERDIKKYESLRSKADADQNQLLQLIYGDPDFCAQGPYERTEFLALKAIFQQAITLTKVNNGHGVITSKAFDYQLAKNNKRAVKSDQTNRQWTNPTTAKPIKDIKDVIAYARSQGIRGLQYLLMNDTKFADFIAADEVKEAVLPYTAASIVKGDVATPEPSAVEVNKYMGAKNLPQIIVVDSSIEVEDESHNYQTIDPTLTETDKDSMVILTKTLKMGKVFWTKSVDELRQNKNIAYSKKGPVLVKKFFKSDDPVAERTMGIFWGLPVPTVLDTMFRLNTENNTATGLDS